MKQHRWAVILTIVLMGLLLLYSCTYLVDYRDVAIVKTFGKASDPIVGAEKGKAGFRWKWPAPVQTLVRYDGRMLSFEDTYEEIQTKDRQNVIVTLFCAWRIKDAGAFYPKARTIKNAEQSLLRDRLLAAKGAVIGKHPLADLVNTDPGAIRTVEIEEEIRSRLQEGVADYGIKVEAVWIKFLALPGPVTKTVIRTMIAERDKFAQKERDRGKSEAARILAQAQTDSGVILDFARRKAKDISVEGDRAAAEMLKAFSENEPLAMFLLELEYLREILKDNTFFVLDPTNEPSLRFLTEGPSLPKINKGSK